MLPPSHESLRIVDSVRDIATSNKGKGSKQNPAITITNKKRHSGAIGAQREGLRQGASMISRSLAGYSISVSLPFCQSTNLMIRQAKSMIRQRPRTRNLDWVKMPWANRLRCQSVSLWQRLFWSSEYSCLKQTGGCRYGIKRARLCIHSTMGIAKERAGA